MHLYCNLKNRCVNLNCVSLLSLYSYKSCCCLFARGLRRDCQLLLFSATYDDQVMRFAESIVHDAIVIKLRREEQSLDNIKQYYIECSSLEDKFSALSNIYGSISIGQSMIFCHVSVLHQSEVCCVTDVVETNEMHACMCCWRLIIIIIIVIIQFSPILVSHIVITLHCGMIDPLSVHYQCNLVFNTELSFALCADWEFYYIGRNRLQAGPCIWYHNIRKMCICDKVACGRKGIILLRFTSCHSD